MDGTFLGRDAWYKEVYKTLDEMWNYESCAWENVTLWKDSTHRRIYFVGDAKALDEGSHQSEGHSWEDGAWKENFRDMSGHTQIINKDNVKGEWEAYVNVWFSNGEKWGVEADIDHDRLDDQGRAMYEVTYYYGTDSSTEYITVDKMPPFYYLT